ncbi:MAG TPA: hypothetical protein K8V90_01500 [Romboutsia timonensis]|uniref:Uncharacterized protein n=1 Tax=Romboutsia timonensis TaxID=1776391 RepID=A0A921MZW0_9FIRM|nr:hypothetical protein [Romboutsia timonensis]
MNIDKDLLQYCKDKEFPIREMNEKDFKTVENTLDFQHYKLGLEFKKLAKNVLNALKKIEHRKKSCKNFKCK